MTCFVSPVSTFVTEMALQSDLSREAYAACVESGDQDGVS